jgi:hypothetical protein
MGGGHGRSSMGAHASSPERGTRRGRRGGAGGRGLGGAATGGHGGAALLLRCLLYRAFWSLAVRA